MSLSIIYASQKITVWAEKLTEARVSFLMTPTVVQPCLHPPPDTLLFFHRQAVPTRTFVLLKVSISAFMIKDLLRHYN